MIISISPPSSISLRSMQKQTKIFFGRNHSIRRNSNGLIAAGNKYMVLVRRNELLLSFSSDDLDAVSFLQKYLTCLFKNDLVVVDLANPITNELDFVVTLPQSVIS